MYTSSILCPNVVSEKVCPPLLNHCFWLGFWLRLCLPVCSTILGVHVSTKTDKAFKPETLTKPWFRKEPVCSHTFDHLWPLTPCTEWEGAWEPNFWAEREANGAHQSIKEPAGRPGTICLWGKLNTIAQYSPMLGLLLKVYVYLVTQNTMSIVLHETYTVWR